MNDYDEKTSRVRTDLFKSIDVGLIKTSTTNLIQHFCINLSSMLLMNHFRLAHTVFLSFGLRLTFSQKDIYLNTKHEIVAFAMRY